MLKKIVQFVSVAALMIFATTSSFADASPSVNFGIDCMIHDSQGKMLKDLGMIGMMMDGSFTAIGNYSYNDVRVEASLQGPFMTAPEVKQTQLRLSFLKSDGTVTASVIMTATSDTNVALWEPNVGIYLHCAKMDM
jgi:hypothetical protein